MMIIGMFCKSLNTHLPLLDSHRLAPWCHLLINAGQEVLGDTQGVLQERVVRVAGGRVFEQVLQFSRGPEDIYHHTYTRGHEKKVTVCTSLLLDI